MTGDADEAPAREAAIRRLEESFGSLVAAYRAQIAEVAESTSPGLLPATYRVLTTVERRGPMSVSALADCMGLDKGQVSRTVSELETLGFIERSADADDRRIRILAVTPLAAERLAAARHENESELSARIRDWPVGAIEQLGDLLSALASGELPRLR